MLPSSSIAELSCDRTPSSASSGVQHWLDSNVTISLDKIKRADVGCQLPSFLTLSQKHHWKAQMGIAGLGMEEKNEK